jgi:hypothetical protein
MPALWFIGGGADATVGEDGYVARVVYEEESWVYVD